MTLSRILFTTALGAFCAASAMGLEIKETRWGFDGHAVPERFAILSVLVTNPGPVPFDGEIALEESRGVGSNMGAPIVQPVYLAPGSSRYVQFQPYVENDNTSWQLRWGRGGKEHQGVDGATMSGPARVIFVDPESPFAAGIRLKSFADDLFPTTVGATDGLDAVVLDHAPRWEVARREAFLDWLRRGGTVHLLFGAKGAWPEFSSELAVLNGTEDRTRIGSGVVLRHKIPRVEVTEKFLEEHGSPARDLRQGKSVSVYSFDQTLLQKLASLTKPRIVWWLIYLLTGSYVLVVGPIHFFAGRKVSYRVSIAAFVGVVALYAASFAWAGRRGADETQRVHSLSIAHSLGGGRYDAMQWISAFVTHGDLYRLTHRAASNLYSLGSGMEAVHGQIRNGREGIFAVDLPLYSSRPFLHRGVMEGDETGVTIEQWKNDAGGKLLALTLRPDAKFPQQVEGVCVREGELIFPMKRQGEVWELEAGQTSETFFAQVAQDLNIGWQPNAEKTDEEAWQKKEMRLLMARELGGAEKLPHFLPPPPLAADQAQLFIFARAPEGFRLQGGDFKSESGWVLYVQDIFQKTTP